ncbi:MAG: IclR family transcriptional regulator [Spirochaetaceae bacterium]|nr:IclR family transcriptional regulator [Spirochaetaceae bacterium]
MTENKVQSLDRTFDILELLASEPAGISLASIAQKTGLPKSTAFRLLSVLLQREYARKSGDTGLYRLGPAFAEMSSHYLGSLELKTESAPFLKALASSLGTIVFLACRQGRNMVYIDRQDQYASLRNYAVIGQQKPLYCTALGKSLMLDMPDDEIALLYEGETLVKQGPKTHTSVVELLADMAECRRRGWCFDNEEAEADVRCVGAPIRDYRGQIISSVSTSWHLDSKPEFEAEKVAVQVVRAAASISASMGWRPGRAVPETQR